MAETEVMVLCYWNGCIKHGPNGVYYEGGSTLKKITVKQKIELSRFLDALYVITALDKEKSKFEIFGRYPVAVVVAVSPPPQFTYLLFPVVNDTSLETMLHVGSNHHPCVEFYLEVKPTSDDVIDPGSSLKRRKIQQLEEANGYVDRDVTHPPVKLETDNGLEIQGVDNHNGWIEDEAGDGMAQAVTLMENNGSVHKEMNEDSKPCLSSLWVDDRELRVGLCFNDSDELKKAVDWCSINGQQKCVVRESEKDEVMFECVRWKCKWTLVAVKMERHGLFEIIKYTGPHTCFPVESKDFDSEFEADEIERVVRVHPTQSFRELKKWWKDNFFYKLDISEVRVAKEEAIKRVFGDWDQSFEDLPKLMSALHSSNGLLVDWKYDLCPNPKFASFYGVFWAFSQSVEGFQHCRPLIIVDTKELNGKYPMKLMIASGLDADNDYFPLAFAVTKEVSVDSWRWFLTRIREKVTQRQGLCLISTGHPDIVTVINEPESQWQEPYAYHRYCLNHLCSQFCLVFPGLEGLVKQAGSTAQKKEFDSSMKKIGKKNSEARRWLDQIPPHTWTLSHDNGRRYGIMKIDTKALFALCRGFKSADHVMTGSVLLLFDELRYSFDQYFVYARASLNVGDLYTKPVTDKLKEFKAASIEANVVLPLEDNNAFQVTTTSDNDEWIVQLSDGGGTCTCGDFQAYKFPCLHALAVCKKLKINPLHYVDDCYSFEQCFKTYSAKFNPVPEVSAWPEGSGIPRLLPPVIPLPLTPPPPTPKVVAGKSQRKTVKKKLKI